MASPLKILNLIPSAKFLLPHKRTYTHKFWVLGRGHLWGHYAHPTFQLSLSVICRGARYYFKDSFASIFPGKPKLPLPLMPTTFPDTEAQVLGQGKRVNEKEKTKTTPYLQQPTMCQTQGKVLCIHT